VPPVTHEVYWSPGYVGWVRTPNYVGWVPLAPGETYYGRGYYGRNSVNITKVNIKQVNITNVYKNVYVNNGATVVNRNTFNTGTPTVVNFNKNSIQRQIFVKNNFSVGAPDIKPTKATYFTSAKTIMPSKLPPQPVRNLQLKELKKSRPFMKAQDKSVLQPGVKPKALPVNTVKTPRTPGKGKPMIQQVKPAEKKHAAPEGGPAPRQIKPSEKRAIVPEGGTTVRGGKQQVKPAERVKHSGPAASPTKRVEKQQVKPAEKKPIAPEGGITVRGGKQQVKPAVSEGGTTVKGEKQQGKPAELDESPQKDEKNQGVEKPE